LTDLFERRSIAPGKYRIAQAAIATSVNRRARYVEFSKISFDPFYSDPFNRPAGQFLVSAIHFQFAAKLVCRDHQRNAARPGVSSF
jgi:hypothetical protein